MGFVASRERRGRCAAQPDRSWRLGLFDQRTTSSKPSWTDILPLCTVSFTDNVGIVERPADVRPDDLAVILFSSGTTGSPPRRCRSPTSTFCSPLTLGTLPGRPSSMNVRESWAGCRCVHSLGLVIEWATTALYSGGTLLLPSTSLGAVSPRPVCSPMSEYLVLRPSVVCRGC